MMIINLRPSCREKTCSLSLPQRCWSDLSYDQKIFLHKWQTTSETTKTMFSEYMRYDTLCCTCHVKLRSKTNHEWCRFLSRYTLVTCKWLLLGRFKICYCYMHLSLRRQSEGTMCEICSELVRQVVY